MKFGLMIPVEIDAETLDDAIDAAGRIRVLLDGEVLLGDEPLTVKVEGEAELAVRPVETHD